MTASRMIDIATIDAGGRLRALDPTWVAVLAEDIAVAGLTDPIRVVERGEGFKLVAGARRIAAMQLLGRAKIEARVEPASVLADETAIQLAEIKADMLRGDLTALDHAVYVATWCEIYRNAHEPAKRGRKAAVAASDEALEELSAKLAPNWTPAAQAALGISRRTVFRSLKIAGIDASLRSRISLYAVADHQSELLILADQSDARQTAIVDMLTADPATATSISEALALLDSVPAAVPQPAYERFYQRFCTLKPVEKHSFFELNAEEIERWQAMRSTQAASKTLKIVA